MVSSSHEAMHRIFRDHPEVIDATFRALGFKFPETMATSLLDTDVTEIRPIERRADTVMKVETKDGRSFIFVFEAQRRIDADKRFSWPYYIAYLHEYYRMPVFLVVICQDDATAKWAFKPIEMRVEEWPSMTVRPYVLGPHNVPVPQGPIGEAGIPLAALAAITHAHDPGIGAILAALATALEDTDAITRTDFTLLTQFGLGGFPAAEIWRSLMIYDLDTLRKSPVLREMLDEHDEQVLAKGRAEGRAADILQLLEFRKIHVTDSERGRILACEDLETLSRWFDAAFTAEKSEDLFG